MWHEAEEDAEERRLARAVRADDGERGPSPHVEIDVFQNRDAVQSNPQDWRPEGGLRRRGFRGLDSVKEASRRPCAVAHPMPLFRNLSGLNKHQVQGARLLVACPLSA